MRSWPFSLVKRTLSALLALILVTVQGGLEPRHACPVHEPEVEQQTDTAHAHAAGHTQPESATPENEHCCTCIGTCLVAAPAALAATGADLAWLNQESAAEAFAVHTDALRHRLPRLLPFATAPPLS